MVSKVVLVTGASSGMGRETAIELKNKGFIVYAGARRIEMILCFKICSRRFFGCFTNGSQRFWN